MRKWPYHTDPTASEWRRSGLPAVRARLERWWGSSLSREAACQLLHSRKLEADLRQRARRAARAKARYLAARERQENYHDHPEEN